MLWLGIMGAFEVAMPEGGEAVVNPVIENQTDTALKEPWIFVFSKPDWLSVSPDSVMTRNLAEGEKVELQLRIKSEPSWSPAPREGTLRLRVLVRNGEVGPDFIEFKVKEGPYELVSLIPFLLSREYEFTHTLTEHYDYYPIIFLHGMATSASYWTQNRNRPYKEVMVALAGFQNYWLYNNGNGVGPGETVGSTLDELYPKRVIYNFDYYIEPWKDNPGAIGSNGTIYPCDDDVEGRYRQNLGVNEVNSYAKRLSDFITLVQDAAYTDKVHIVAHSMGGVVARAAIKWYGCNAKVNRLLMIGTPNHPLFPDVIGKMVFYFLKRENPEWMKDGELLELAHGLNFDEDYFNCLNPDEYLEKLNAGDWAGGVRYGAIAGILSCGEVELCGLLIEILIRGGIYYAKDDGLLDTEEVFLEGAEFFNTHVSSHGSHEAFEETEVDLWVPINYLITVILRQYFDTYGELSLTSNTFVLETIREWIIMDSLRKGDLRDNEIQFIASPSVVTPGSSLNLDLTIVGSSARHVVAAQILNFWYEPTTGRARVLPTQIYGNDSLYALGFSRRDGYSDEQQVIFPSVSLVVPDLPSGHYLLSTILYSTDDARVIFSNKVQVVKGKGGE